MAIEADRRGIFLCMGLLGLRPGEARALDVANYDWQDHWLDVSRAVKGARLDSPIRGTKTGEGRFLPAPPDLADWIENNVDRAGRLAGAPLFVNPDPQSGNRWSPTSIRRTWARACKSVGVPMIAPYEGTKHTFATNALNRGVRIEVVQAILGHRDRRSTERYAKLRNETLVEAIGPRLQPGYKHSEGAEAKKKRAPE